MEPMENDIRKYFFARVDDDPNIIGAYTDRDGRQIVLVLEDEPQRLEAHALFADSVAYVKAPPFVAYQIPTGRFRPAPPGVSTGHYKISAGTLGLVVRDKTDGALSVLSNNHVYGNIDAGKPGDDLLQPGTADGGVRLGDTIADLTRFIPLLGPGTKTVDCAIGKVKRAEDVRLDILNIGYCYGITEAYLDQKIWKMGRTSGLTRGKISGVDAKIQVNYGPAGDIVLDECIVSNIPSQPGDSGSSLIDFASNRCVGLLFAGNGFLTIGCSAVNVFRLLNIETIEPPEITRSQWLDISKWQGVNDFGKMKAAGVRGVIMKVCQGTDIIDTKFTANYDGAKAAGLLVGGYIFVDPEDSAQAHWNNFLAAVGERKFDLPIALDVEKRGSSVTAVVQGLSNLATAWQGQRPLIYTNVSFWNDNLGAWSGWKEHPLWVAYWSDSAYRPSLPRDWIGVEGAPAIWQYDVNDNGPALGAGSGQVDCNLTYPSFEKLLGEQEPPPPPPDTYNLAVTVSGSGWVAPGSGAYPQGETIQLTATPESGWQFAGWSGDVISQANPLNLLMDADKAVTATFTESGGSGPKEFTHYQGKTKVSLNYRNGPGMKYTKIGSMTAGTTVEILETAKEGVNVWARIGYKQWACQNFGGVVYIEYVMA